MKKRLLSLLLVLVMVFTLLPTTAFADIVIVTRLITDVQIDGIDAPVEGELPDREVELPEGAGYTVGAPENFAQSFINGVAWVDKTTDEYMAEGEVFVAGHEYYPVIGLKANAGFAFGNIHNITGKTNLCDAIDVAGFYGADETQYISVYLGTMDEPYSAQPLPSEYPLTLVNCEAWIRSEDGIWNQVTSAKPGQLVAVDSAPEYEGQPFYSWTLNPTYLPDLAVNGGYLQFTMPASPVYLEATYLQKVLVTAVNGKAYDEEGNEITEALPGTKVYLEPNEPAFGTAFAEWYLVSDEEVTVEQEADGRYFITVPYCNVHATAIFYDLPPVPVERLCMDLNGYFVGANVDCLQISEADNKVNFTTNTVTGLDYILLEYDPAKPNIPSQTVVTGTVKRNTIYWLAIELTPATGYNFEGLTKDDILTSFVGSDSVLLMETSAEKAVIFFKLPAISYSRIEKSITVTGGDAFINNTEVIKAASGMRVRLVEGIEPEGSVFTGWNVVAGDVTLELDETDGYYYFTMGSDPVEIEATYERDIDYVDITIAEPMAGKTPSYLAKFISYDCGYTYEDYNVEGSFRSGVAWYDLDTEKYLDPATAVFERGHSYRVYIMLTTQGDKAFYLDEYGYPAVTGCVNGVTDGVYVEQYHEDSSHHVMLTTSFYIEEDAELAEPITQVTLTELEAPVVGQPLSYYYHYDYMEHVSGNYSYDNEATTLNGVTWIDVTDPENPVTMTPMVSVAEAGHMYRVEMLIKPTNNYIFSVGEDGMPAGINATVNGQPCDVTNVPDRPATHLIKVISYQYCGDPITNVAIYDVDTPAPSYGFDYYAVVEEGADYALDYSYAEEYFLNGVRWTNLTEDPNVHMQPELGVAGSDREYRVSIIVKAADGCAFRVDENGMPDLNATVNGVPCEVSTVGDLDASKCVMLTYNVTSYKLHSISVLDGGLAVCPTDVTDAKTDAYTTEQIMLIPTNKESEGLEFSHWEVVEGQMGNWDMTNANLVFEMPNCDMVFRPVYKSATTELIKWVGTQLQATSNLDMQFALRASDLNGTTGNYIVLTRTYVDGSTDAVKIPQADWTVSGDFYIVAYSGIAAKEMNDMISAVAYNANGEVISETRSESIVTYALSMLGKITNPEQKTMFVDLLNYGAEAQKFFHYDEAHLANAGLTDAQKALATQEDIEVADHRVKGPNFFGSQLSLENVILLQMAFKVAPAEGMYAVASFTNHNGKKVEETLAVENNNGYSMVSVNSLAIADYCTDVTVTLYNADGSVAGSATDSMASYVARSKTDLGKAIMKFGASAYAYFH